MAQAPSQAQPEPRAELPGNVQELRLRLQEDGRATASDWGDGGSIPIGGALEVWPCDFGPKQFG